MAELYLLHFQKPYWSKCQHYVGITKFTAEERCAVHRGNKHGRPSKLVQYALAHGNDFVIAHIEKFESDAAARQREKQLKRNGHFSKLCPVCKVNCNLLKDAPMMASMLSFDEAFDIVEGRRYYGKCSN
jgi:predicted GIY-YIG superfamily endonuclease